MVKGIEFEFEATVWVHASDNQGNSKGGSWHFVTLPVELSLEIRSQLAWQEEGWGRLKATAQIGSTSWKTAIWYDTQHGSYLLPIKSDVRKKENIAVGDLINIKLWV